MTCSISDTNTWTLCSWHTWILSFTLFCHSSNLENLSQAPNLIGEAISEIVWSRCPKAGTNSLHSAVSPIIQLDLSRDQKKVVLLSFQACYPQLSPLSLLWEREVWRVISNWVYSTGCCQQVLGERVSNELGEKSKQVQISFAAVALGCW